LTANKPINLLLVLFWLLIFIALSAFSKLAQSDVGSPGFSKQILEEINLAKPYENSSWVALMGGKVRKGFFAEGYIATEDGNDFYTAKYNGDNWLKDEFLIALKNLLDPASKQAFFCNYPARSFWILNNFSDYFESTASPSCPDVDKWVSRFTHYELSLAFASSDFSQPASIFGHTFIALHRGEAEFLDGYAINYAANFEDQANSINYFVNGLVGAYPGVINITPLYKKIKEYTVESQRSIYLYKLKLSEKQKRQFILTLWERKKAKFDYLFVSENCSYAILKLLQILEPSIEVPRGLLGQVIPFETVRSVENAKLIDFSSVTYPFAKKIQNNLHRLSSDSKKLLLALIKQRITFEEWLARKQGITSLTALQYLNLRIQQDDVDRVYARKLRNLLTENALLMAESKGSNSIVQELPTYTDLFQTHLPNRVSIALKNSNIQGNFLDLNLRWAYHDFLDPVSPLLNSSSVEAFSGTFRVSNGDTSLERLDIISVKSLPNYSNLFPKKSTNFNIELTRSDLTNDKLGFNLAWGRGLSKHTGDGGIFYGLINFEWLYSSQLLHSNAIGYSSELGYNRSLSSNSRLFIKAHRKWYPNEKYRETLFYTGVNFFVNERTAITAELFSKDSTVGSETIAGMRLNHFF